VNDFKKAPAWNVKVHPTASPGRHTPSRRIHPLCHEDDGPAGIKLVTSGTKDAFDLGRCDMKPMAITFGTFLDKPANGPCT
jgi:hypothetical protein